MRIAVVGGGPGGLYFAALAKQLGPQHEITVWERNAPDDTFGFGVVFSDETLGGIEHADPVVAARLEREFARWDDIDVHYRGEVVTCGGHGFAAMGRKRLLEILQQRCRDLGVELRFRAEAPDVESAAPRARPGRRRRRGELGGARPLRRRLRPDRRVRPVPLHVAGHRQGLRGVHLRHPRDPARRRAAARLPLRRAPAARSSSRCTRTCGAGRASTPTRTWRPAAPTSARSPRSASCSPTCSTATRCRPTTRSGSASRTVSNERWCHGNVVLLGDAAHTAHFSIGSGTKLAMEDALSLAACLHECADIPGALAAYEQERRPVVLSTQRAARASQRVVREPRPVPAPGAGPVRASTSSPAAAGSPTTTCACATRGSSPASTPGSPTGSREPPRSARRCSSRSGSASWSWPTGSWSRRWTCTSPPTGCPASSTWSTWAARRSAGPGW